MESNEIISAVGNWVTIFRFIAITFVVFVLSVVVYFFTRER